MGQSAGDSALPPYSWALPEFLGGTLSFPLSCLSQQLLLIQSQCRQHLGEAPGHSKPGIDLHGLLEQVGPGLHPVPDALQLCLVLSKALSLLAPVGRQASGQLTMDMSHPPS